MRNRQATQLLFEQSKPGCRAAVLPECDVPRQPLAKLLPASALAAAPPPLPELTEPDLVRHFVNLSTANMSVDTHFYPLGSCTMKYNPKRNERLANLPGFVDLHPYQPEETLQGMLQLLHAGQQMLAEIAGLEAVSLQPAAGAHGEMTALLVAAAYFRDQGQKRSVVLIPDGAHGTNPASASMAGFQAVEVKSDDRGLVDLADLAAKLSPQVAVFMITNPNTLGIFDGQIAQIAEIVHGAGALVYLDGANMNAILGIARPGDFGADMMHYNPHKTFSTPHGGGGPGAGPVAVAGRLAPYLPAPLVVRDGDRYRLDYDRPKSIGRVRAFFGNTGVLVRMYSYLLTHGPDGLRRVAENAVLNANYLLSRVKHFLPVPRGERCMHEFVASAASLKAEREVTAMDIAKRLLDYGFHAPTVYFPLIVREALMIEPTETESKATLDAFAEALFRITEEPLDLLQESPHSTQISRPDEVRAARKPVLHWSPGERAAAPTTMSELPVAECRLLIDAPAAGAWNMAVDEVLWRWSAATGRCCWRFYRWREPTLSLGYFQSYEERWQHLSSRQCPAVRRPSGGGAIVHDKELTYSLSIPTACRWAAQRSLLYETIHNTLIDALAPWGVMALLCQPGGGVVTARQPFLCFQRRAAGDVLVENAKIAGSAQRRTRESVLQHGSVLLSRSAAAPELDGLENLAARSIEEERLIAVWLDELSRQFGLRWQEDHLTDAERREAECLVETKYNSPLWSRAGNRLTSDEKHGAGRT